MVLGSLLVAAPGYRAVVDEVRRGPGTSDPWVAAQAALAPLVAAEPGEVLADEPALAAAGGRPLLFEFMIFDLLAGQRYWDERPILDAIRARRFSLVILSMPLDTPKEQARWSAAVGDALRAAYAPAGMHAGYWLYRATTAR